MNDGKRFQRKLEGARVLIIGGTSGIGVGVAEGCIEEGVMDLILVSSREQRVNTAIALLRQSYLGSTVKIDGYACDLSSESTLEANLVDLFGKVGMLDHIVFTAGDTPPNLQPTLRTFSSVRSRTEVEHFRCHLASCRWTMTCRGLRLKITSCCDCAGLTN